MVTVMGGKEVTVSVIIECAIRGSAEKWQIHTQWSHFLRLMVTVMHEGEVTVCVIIECAIGGLPESGKFIRSGDTF